jgi:hypothetical protein
MTQTTAPIAGPPAMAAFVAKVATLSRLAADLTKLAIEVQSTSFGCSIFTGSLTCPSAELPDIVQAAIDSAFQGTH